VKLLDRLLPWRRKKRVTLVCMRTQNMVRVHPQQVTRTCARCGAPVGVYPSGQGVLRDYSDVEIICEEHGEPLSATLAPGAAEEPFQSVPRRHRRW